MEVLTAFSQANRNQSWMNHGGSWLAWLFTIALGHFILISMPFFSTPTVWTLTHVLHNLLVYILFHHVKGTPFVSGDQGNSRRLTSWEQMDDGEQLTANKKFIIGVTILLFLLASTYTFGDRTHTVINIAALVLGIVPKLSIVHKFRLFGINKY